MIENKSIDYNPYFHVMYIQFMLWLEKSSKFIDQKYCKGVKEIENNSVSRQYNNRRMNLNEL